MNRAPVGPSGVNGGLDGLGVSGKPVPASAELAHIELGTPGADGGVELVSAPRAEAATETGKTAEAERNKKSFRERLISCVAQSAERTCWRQIKKPIGSAKGRHSKPATAVPLRAELAGRKGGAIL